jgi:hypothetical protein
MSERVTSPAERDELKRAINAATDRLESQGFERGQIGAAMTGIGIAMVAGGSCKLAMKIIDRLRDELLMDGSKPS